MTQRKPKSNLKPKTTDALGSIRAVLERRATSGTLADRNPHIEEETARLVRAIEALTDERDRLSEELMFIYEESSGRRAAPVPNLATSAAAASACASRKSWPDRYVGVIAAMFYF